MRRLYLYGFVFFFLWGCDPDDEGTIPETVIVDGLVYMGQTVKVNLSLLSPVNTDNPIPLTDPPVVAIRSQEQNFPLFPLPGFPGTYADPVNEIPLIPGQAVIMFFVHQQDTIAAITTMPFAPEGMALDRVIIPLNATDLETENADTLRWLNAEERHFTAKLTLVDSNPVQIIDSEVNPQSGFVFGVITGNRYAIPHNALRYYGLYQLVLYSVNPMFEQFFANNVQSQVQQTTNINNGLGLFTAINSDTSYFLVVPR